MAARKIIGLNTYVDKSRHMKTSIGHSTNTSPKNKNKKRNWKQYRGQGK